MEIVETDKINNWLHDVEEKLRRDSPARVVEISIAYADVTTKLISVQNGNVLISQEDWKGENCTGVSPRIIKSGARAAVLKIAQENGWYLFRDGLEMLVFEDGQRMASKGG